MFYNRYLKTFINDATIFFSTGTCPVLATCTTAARVDSL